MCAWCVDVWGPVCGCVVRGVWACWCGCADVAARGAVCGCEMRGVWVCWRGCVDVGASVGGCVGVWERAGVGVGVFFYIVFRFFVFSF